MKRTERGGGHSSPRYLFQHVGPCLVAGNAFCLHDDIARARKLFHDAPAIAVNGAAREVKAIALYSSHPERFVAPGFEWIRHQRRLFGDGFTVHASKFVPDCLHVQYWWEDARGGGGSAWGARKLAGLMGFDPVVLCGCPLVPGNYAGDRPGQIMTRLKVLEPMRREIEEDTAWHHGAYSMSGWTRNLLGEPC